MEVFFISPSINLGVWVNYGIASLCGVIKEKGHHAELYQPVRFDIDDFYDRFGQKKYALCLVSTVTNQWPHALKYIRALRKVSQIPIIVGGHHVTCCPDVIDENPEIDGICIGEGDVALGALLDRMVEGKEYHDLKNMWFRREHEVIRNEIGDLIEDLDALPFPDYSVFSAQAIAGRPSILLSRGCPYNCTYCCNNFLRRLYAGKGRYVRKKSVKRAIEEVRDFIDRYRPDKVNFDDDTFVKDKKWLLAFLKEYRQFTDTLFDCNSRPETLDDEICRALKEAHCDILCVGIESGNEQFRKNVLHRNMTNESIMRAFSLLKKHGIKSYAFNIVGAPEDTYENYLETVRLNQAIRPDGYQITIFYPYPGSDLFNRAKEMGLLTENTFRDSFESQSLLRMKQFPRWKISFAKNTFGYRLMSEEKTFLQEMVLLIDYFSGGNLCGLLSAGKTPLQKIALLVNYFSGGSAYRLVLFLRKLRIRDK